MGPRPLMRMPSGNLSFFPRSRVALRVCRNYRTTLITGVVSSSSSGRDFRTHLGSNDAKIYGGKVHKSPSDPITVPLIKKHDWPCQQLPMFQKVKHGPWQGHMEAQAQCLHVILDYKVKTADSSEKFINSVLYMSCTCPWLVSLSTPCVIRLIRLSTCIQCCYSNPMLICSVC